MSASNSGNGTCINKVTCHGSDIENLSSSVCTDSISFISARSAISKAFCGSASRNNSSYSQAFVKKEWSLVKVNRGNLDIRHSELQANTAIGGVTINQTAGAHVVESSCTSVSYDGINQDLFMFTSRFPRPCFCWKRSFFGCSYCSSRFCWTWPGWRSQPYYGKNIMNSKSRSHSFYPFCPAEANQFLAEPCGKRKDENWGLVYNKEKEALPNQSSAHWLPSISGRQRKNRSARKKRLVMEEAERKEENERWRERGGDRGAASEVATLPVKRPWMQNSRITTRAILEGARHLSSNDGPSLNGILSRREGEQRNHSEQIDPDDKPPKLVVNLNHSDKASQAPEPLPVPEPDIESKKIDETDGNPEQENSCLVDCLYVTLQCCDCSIM